MFDFDDFLFKLSGNTVDYICPKCKNKFVVPIDAVLRFEQEDEWNGLLFLLQLSRFVQNIILINLSL